MSGSTIPTLTVTPSGISPAAGASAYGRVANGTDEPAATSGASFGSALQRAILGVVATGEQADALSMMGTLRDFMLHIFDRLVPIGGS